MKTQFVGFMLAVLTMLSPMTLAAERGEQKQVFGEYEVHYIGLNTSFLTPETARLYDIQRSRSLGFLSISILHNQADADLPVAVQGQVTGQIKNLIGQSRELVFKEIVETGAVYYISSFRFDDEELQRIQLQVTPDGQPRTFDVKFSQKFYQD